MSESSPVSNTHPFSFTLVQGCRDLRANEKFSIKLTQVKVLPRPNPLPPQPLQIPYPEPPVFHLIITETREESKGTGGRHHRLRTPFPRTSRCPRKRTTRGSLGLQLVVLYPKGPVFHTVCRPFSLTGFLRL